MASTKTTADGATHKQEDATNFEKKYRLRYYDTCGFFRFLFIEWPRSWMNYLNKEFVDIDELHPLPKADDISYWQPIFSKYVSDGLLQLEKADYDEVNPNSGKKARGYKHIVLKALLKTFWVRCMILVLGNLFMHMVGVGTSLLLKYLLGLMASENRTLSSIIGMILIIVGVEFFNAVLSQHIFLYFNRVHICMESVLTVTMFQHGMSHRRAYASAIGGCPVMGNCKGIVHSWPCNNEACASNPLKCPARRHQNKELPPNMYVYLFVDSYAVIRIIDAMVEITKFLSTFIMSMLIISGSIGMNVLLPGSIVVSIVMSMVVIEVINGYVWLHTLRSKDNTVARTTEAIRNLNVLRVMGMEDIGYNMVQDSRNDEMKVLKTRTAFHSTSIFLNRILGVSVLLFVLLDYIKNMKDSINDSNFDIATPITVMFIVEKITAASENLPKTMKTIVEFATSLTRVEKFVRTCSPNYYLKPVADYTPKVRFNSAKLGESNEEISDDTVVQFKKASFTWINSRKDVVRGKDKTPLFTGLDFELKRGDIKIITGAQGCGKTSFIKSILGEMSLVSGSMAVAPLSTGMPIFYTSQEVWLPTDSIRSIITFGYAFNEEVYNEVVRCAELLTDFSSWEDGDQRVISEKGYSLSGGQRVRVSLARALYAYMIFSKANESMDQNRCCFLMCLDEPFNGLDVNVATSIFNNLFNKDTGLLVRDDIAIVMAMSKMSMGICFSSNCDAMQRYMLIHHINEGNISKAEPLSNYYGNVSHDSEAVFLVKGSSSDLPSSLSAFTPTLMKQVVTGRAVSKSANRCKENLSKNAVDALIEDTAKRTSGETYESYFTFFSAIGYTPWVFIMILILASIVINQVNSVYVAHWSDSVKSTAQSGKMNIEAQKKILMKHERIAHYVTIFVAIYISLTYVGNILCVVAGLISSNKLYTYAANSLFFRSSQELPLKKAMGDIITLLSADFYFIDEVIAKVCLNSISAILNLLIQFVTICYTSPMVIPVPILMCAYLYTKVAKAHIMSSKRLQCFMFEAMGEINAAYEDAMEGSTVYRSYRRETQCMDHIYECSETFIKTRFLKKTFPAWIVIVSKIFTSIMVVMVSLSPLITSQISGKRVYVANTGLGITLTLGLNSIITSLVYNCSLTERMMCSMARFDHYFLQGKFSLKEKFESMNESILSGFGSASEREQENKKRLAELMIRRKAEYKDFMFRRYRSVLSTLFYKPKIDVLDIASYLPADHTTLTLDKVHVPQPGQSNAEVKRYILTDVSASTNAGDVVGIVGRTGAGKSTLLSVLQNITRKREGAVLLDGRELNSIPRSILRHIIGVLPQIPFVFKGWTLRRFLDPRMLYSDDEIFNALECCGLLDLVKSLPEGKGLDVVLTPEEVKVHSGLYLLTPLIKLKNGRVTTVVDEDECSPGAKPSSIPKTCFSMTQLRMLSFARLVLYKDNYRILLIDEPPSDNIHANEGANEGDTENKESTDGSLPIYNLVKIYFKHCTTFIVAHDKKILNYCNMLWEMNYGQLLCNKSINGGSFEM